MAVTKILPRNGGLKEAIDYVLNGDKTDGRRILRRSARHLLYLILMIIYAGVSPGVYTLLNEQDYIGSIKINDRRERTCHGLHSWRALYTAHL